ncbi:hypothetical protein POSPLADRAFT_1063274 [Postia placenta MAD-698-R-SB12]|uniref:Uncharacterized protein n=1 Tax=Postia placenta MAD-698-R-SB12 TaxID=670580 RepID=A0A1X6MI49_9APHY|nr:hypothetical protein POSPLADRAFT_1063274 [Postia placenta MAD-698-R-SB12]OSX55916.1 hypothetical protein POSPLADRAFT_1063274 [Postia placenta MAD-698-R-SB12]
MSRHLRCLPAVGRVYKPAARIPAGALARTSRAPQRRLPYPRTPEVYPSTENPPTAKRVRFARATRTFLPGNPTASARPAAGHRNRALLARAMTAGPGPGTACPNVPARRGASGTAQAWRMWAEPAVLPDVAASFVLPLLADASAGEMAPNAVFHALLRVSAAFVHGRLRAPGDTLEDPSSRYSRRPPPATRHLLPDNLASRRQPPTAPASNRRQCFRPMTRAQIVCIVAVESLGQASLPQCTDGETPWPTDDTSR